MNHQQNRNINGENIPVNNPPNMIKSCPSNHIALVKFCNCSSRDVSLEWIGFRGEHVIYIKNLKPHHFRVMKTYVGHPWVAYDSKYRYPMVFSPERCIVYFPAGSQMILNETSHSVTKILTSLCSLEKLCLQALHQQLPNEDVVHQLPISTNLKKKLQKLYYFQKSFNLPVINLVDED